MAVLDDIRDGKGLKPITFNCFTCQNDNYRGGRAMDYCKKCKNFRCNAAGTERTTECEDYMPHLPTNADRIRAMTDDELMTWIMEMQACPYELYQDCQHPNYDCETCIKDWLRQEAET